MNVSVGYQHKTPQKQDTSSHTFADTSTGIRSDQTSPYEAKTRGEFNHYAMAPVSPAPTAIPTSSQVHLYTPRPREVGEQEKIRATEKFT